MTSRGTMASTHPVDPAMTQSSALVLERETVKWGPMTLVLPKLPLATQEVETTFKASLLKSTITSVREQGGDDKWNIKCDLIQSRFGYDTVRQTAKNKLSLFLNPTSPIWSYGMIRSLDAQGTTVALTVDAQGALTDAYRQNAWYIEINVTCTPRLAYPTCTTLPEPETTNVLLALPRLNNQVDAAVNTNMIAYPMLLLVWMQSQANLPIQFVNRAQNGNVTSKEWKKFFENVYTHSQFEVSQLILQDLYVGVGVISTPAQRLRALNQSYVDSSGATQVRSIQDHFRIIFNILAEMQDGPIGLDVCEASWNTLNRPLRDKLQADGYELPATAGLTNDQQLDNLRTLRDAAERAQKGIDSIASIALGAQASGRRSMGSTNAFMSAIPPTPIDLPRPPVPFYMAPSLPSAPSYGTAFAATSPIYEDEYYYNEFEDTEAIVAYLSGAELALREANGTRAPMICWGCGELHRFSECPRKDEPDIRANAQQKIDDWKRNFVRRGYREENTMIPGHKIKSEWRALGFPSAAIADSFIKIVSTDTSVGERKSLIEKLTSKKRAMLSAPLDADRIYGPKQPDDPNDPGTAIFFSIPLGDDNDSSTSEVSDVSSIAMLAPTNPNPPLRRFPFSMTSRLPQIGLPIGLNENMGILLGLLDTCAGVNLGNRRYHEAIMAFCPSIVAAFTDFKKEDYRVEPIGDIGGGTAKVLVTASMDYFMPFQINGTRSRLRIGLSEEVVTNTVYSIPFIIRCGFVLDFKSGTAYSAVFGETFKINYVVPPLDEAPPMQNPEMGLSLLSLQDKAKETPKQE